MPKIVYQVKDARDDYAAYMKRFELQEHDCPCNDGDGCDCCETCAMPAALIDTKMLKELTPFTHYLTPEENETIDQIADDLIDQIAADLMDMVCESHTLQAMREEFGAEEIAQMALVRASEKIDEDGL